jgi:hypothetical protein
MANEINLQVTMSVAKGTLRYQFAPPSANINLTGNNAAGGVQNISTTTTQMQLINVTTRGMANFMNLSTGTKVEIGTFDGTFRPFGLLNAGEPAVIRLAAQAGTNLNPVARVIDPAGGTANVQWQVFSE